MVIRCRSPGMGERFISMPERRTHLFGFWIEPQGKKKLLRECLMSITRQIGSWDQREFSTLIALPHPPPSHSMNSLQRVSYDGSQLRGSSKNGEDWPFHPTKRGQHTQNRTLEAPTSCWPTVSNDCFFTGTLLSTRD